jgi:large subunit ribosomal protein L28
MPPGTERTTAMSRVCDICGKSKHVGGSIVRRGLAKKKGGIGMHVVKNTKRVFSPNIQRVRVRGKSGSVERKRVCTACIRAGKIEKA